MSLLIIIISQIFQKGIKLVKGHPGCIKVIICKNFIKEIKSGREIHP